ncbi:hypothetical protein ACC745_38830, partial [Rhizobium ruizarguesonis]
ICPSCRVSILDRRETTMRKAFYSSQSIYSEPCPYREALMLGGDAPELIARIEALKVLMKDMDQ